MKYTQEIDPSLSYYKEIIGQKHENKEQLSMVLVTGEVAGETLKGKVAQCCSSQILPTRELGPNGARWQFFKKM